MTPRANEVRGMKAGDVGVILAHGGGALAFAAFMLAFRDRFHWYATATLITIAVCVAIFVMLRCFARWMDKPDYVTARGVAVWANGMKIPKELMERAEERFIKVMLKEVPGEVSEPELIDMLLNTGVEWENGGVQLKTGRYEMRDSHGIQHGHRIIVRWPGNIAESALYHELLHEVNETIRLPKLSDGEDRIQFRLNDCQHREPAWWRLEGILVDTF